MFPDCGSPDPTIITIAIHQPGTETNLSTLLVTIHNDRHRVLASSFTRWHGSMHDYLLATVDAAYMAFVHCEDINDVPAIIQQHHQDAVEARRGSIERHRH
jgi:hypothetical protein